VELDSLEKMKTINKKKWNNKGWSDFDTDFYRKTPWLKLRKFIITENPLCVLHLEHGMIEEAKILDHIIPRRLCIDLELEESNLQPLCNECHSQKSGLEVKYQDLFSFLKELENGKLRFITPYKNKMELFKVLPDYGIDF